MYSNAVRKEDNIVYFPSPKLTVVNNKKAGQKSEVYPFQVGDIKKIISYFEEREMWLDSLLFVLSCNLARRISDTLSLKWKNFYNPDTGQFRNKIEIKEKKTDKFANPYINDSCKEAIDNYIQRTGCDPAANNYENDVFLQLSGNYAGSTITSSGYLKALKKAGAEVGITYNIGTHSTRKTFGMINKMIHNGDPYAMDIIQGIFGHSDMKTTENYIGLTDEKVHKYYTDFSDWWSDYVIGEKEYIAGSDSPVVTLDANDLRDIISEAYKVGIKNAGSEDGMVHVDAINDLMKKVNGAAK